MKKNVKIYITFKSTRHDYKVLDSDTNEVKLLKEILDKVYNKRVPRDGTVYMQSSAYSEIFGKTLKGTNREKRFIKIKSLETNKTVYRVLRAKTGNYESKDILYADSETRDILTEAKFDQPVELEILKSNRFLNYFHNYDLYDRISFKITMISLLTGVLSLVITLLK